LFGFPLFFTDRILPDGQPIGASQSAIQIVSANDTRGQINITIANTSLNCPLASHPIFSTFST
jgi:hypothetical protein